MDSETGVVRSSSTDFSVKTHWPSLGDQVRLPTITGARAPPTVLGQPCVSTEADATTATHLHPAQSTAQFQRTGGPNWPRFLAAQPCIQHCSIRQLLDDRQAILSCYLGKAVQTWALGTLCWSWVPFTAFHPVCRYLEP